MEDTSMSIYDNTITPTYLYIKQHSITGLKYFGKTKSKDPIKYKGSGTYWKKHINKHGIEFVETIWLSEPYTDKKLITEHALTFSKENNIVDSTEWANLILENGLDGGGIKGSPGIIPSAESRAKMSASQKGKKQTAETVAQRIISNSGKKRSVDVCLKISIANTGKKWTDTQREKLTGNKRSEETRAKMAAAKIGKHRLPFSDETRAKMSAAQQNISAETKAKMSKPKSEETKLRMSKAAKERVYATITCPFCEIAGKGSNMVRYHFDKCKQKIDKYHNTVGISNAKAFTLPSRKI